MAVLQVVVVPGLGQNRKAFPRVVGGCRPCQELLRKRQGFVVVPAHEPEVKERAQQGQACGNALLSFIARSWLQRPAQHFPDVVVFPLQRVQPGRNAGRIVVRLRGAREGNDPRGMGLPGGDLLARNVQPLACILPDEFVELIAPARATPHQGLGHQR